MKRLFPALAPLLLCVSAHAVIPDSVPEVQHALAAVVSQIPVNLERLQSVPVEFALLTCVLPYGEEPLPRLAPNPGKDALMARLAAKETYWRRIDALLVEEVHRLWAAQENAWNRLQEAKNEGDLMKISDAARMWMLTSNAGSVLVDKQDAVRYIMNDIGDDRKLVEGGMTGAVRLEQKQNLLRAIGRKLARN